MRSLFFLTELQMYQMTGNSLDKLKGLHFRKEFDLASYEISSAR